MDNAGNELLEESYELSDITVVEEDEEKKESFTITFTEDVITEPVTLSYSTRLNADLIGSYDVSNDITLSGGQEQREIYTQTETTTAQQWTYGGGCSGRTLEFTLEKLHENGETPIPGATFEFMKHTTAGTEIPRDNIITTDDDGKFLIEGARAGRYTVTETAVPKGYQKLMEPFYVVIGYSTPEEIEDGADAYKITVTDENWDPISSDIASSEGNILTVYNGVETGEVSAAKEWVNAEESYYPTTWFKLYRSLGDTDPEPVEGAEIKEINSNTSTQEVTWEMLKCMHQMPNRKISLYKRWMLMAITLLHQDLLKKKQS